MSPNSFIYRIYAIYADSPANSFVYRIYAKPPGVGVPRGSMRLLALHSPLLNYPLLAVNTPLLPWTA